MEILWGFCGDFVGVLWVDRLNLFEMPRRDSNPQTRVYITGLLYIFLIFRGIKGVLVIFCFNPRPAWRATLYPSNPFPPMVRFYFLKLTLI